MLLQRLENDVKDWGKSTHFLGALYETNLCLDCAEYLSPVTVGWCITTLENMGFIRDSENTELNSLVCTNLDAYIALKSAIKEQMEQNLCPLLTESVKPTGGYNWRPQASVVQGVAEEMHHFGEGEDLPVMETDFKS